MRPDKNLCNQFLGYSDPGNQPLADWEAELLVESADKVETGAEHFRIETERFGEHVMDFTGDENEISRIVLIHNSQAAENWRWTLTRVTPITVYKRIAL